MPEGAAAPAGDAVTAAVEADVADGWAAPPGANRLAAAAAAFLMVVGATVLVVGWWAGVDIVTRVLPDLVSMKANTATGFLLLGVGLSPAVRRRAPTLAAGASAAALLLGAATWFEYAAGANLGIDELLATDTITIGTPFPGRMGLNTAIGFTGLGTALLLVRPGRASRGAAAVVAQTVAALVMALALMAFVAYLFGVTAGTALGSATQMALHTSVTFLVACLGFLAATIQTAPLRPLARPDRIGWLARRMQLSVLLALLGAATVAELLRARGTIQQRELELAVTVVLAIVAAAGLMLLAAHRLARAEDAIAAAQADLQRANQALAALNDELESRVEQRTQDLAASRQRLEDQAVQLAHSNAELAQFAHTVAHDIRTPLTVLRGFLDLLDQRADVLDAEARRSMIQRCVRAAGRLGDMVNGVLSFADQTEDPTTTPADLAAATAKAVASVEDAADQVEAKIEVAPLPRVWGNAAALQMVMFNLLTNAVKYRDRSRPLHVAVTAEDGSDDRWVEIAVTDNGVGVPEADRTRVFAEGQRLATATGSSIEGSGLGLATVARIIQRHGGRIWVDDAPDGSGSSFRFTLLRAPANLATEPT